MNTSNVSYPYHQIIFVRVKVAIFFITFLHFINKFVKHCRQEKKTLAPRVWWNRN